MNINGNTNVKPAFTATNTRVRRIFDNKSAKQGQKNNTGVILEFTKKARLGEITDINELSERGHNNTLKIMEYQEKIRGSVNHKGLSDNMMCMTEKYYKMIDELKEEYSDEDDFNRYKDYLDRAFDNEIQQTAMAAASCITAPFIGLLRMPPIITGTSAREEIDLARSIEAYNNKYSNLIGKLKRKYGARIYNDTLNAFNNIRSYYDKHRSFGKITNRDISKNNLYMSADDFNNIYDIEKNIDKKLIALGQSNNKSPALADDVKNTVDNMNCSNFIKDMYTDLYNLAVNNS